MCEWKSKYDQDYKCPEGPLPPYPPGYCILHSRDENKDLEAFKQKVDERMNAPDGIDLRGCYFPKDFPFDYFVEQPFDKPVDFLEATFSQDANFSGAKFSQEADFSEATFSQVDFSRATFSQETDFSGATFSQVDFYRATFSEVNFSEATFSQWADFSVATFSQEAYFSGTKFSQANFSVATFSRADFSRATFSQAYFSGATFSKEAYFRGATFSQGAVFYEATFSGMANFTSAKLKEADFSGTHFEKGAIFSHAEFQDGVLFLPIETKEEKQEARKLRRVILGPSKFHRTRFMGEAVFEDIDLSQCSFIHSNIDKVDFRYCDFAKVKGRQNVLKDELDCDQNVGAVRLRRMAVRERTGSSPDPTEKDAREGYEPVHRLYLELKKNFEEKKDWNTAGDFHYGEMECRRKMKGPLGRYFFSLEALYYWASG